MRLTIESGNIGITARELSFFSRTKNQTGAKSLFFFTKTSAAPLISHDDFYYHVSGEIDFDIICKNIGISSFDKPLTLEATRFVKRVSSRTTPYSDPRFLCEAVLCAAAAAHRHAASEVTLRIRIMEDSGKSTCYETRADYKVLSRLRDSVVERALPFIKIEAERRTTLRDHLRTLPFPYREIRGGQRDFINDTFYAAKTGGRLLVSAPTGIGKTISALYPALRAVGSGHVDRVFYLTAKTVTGKAAQDAVRAMAKCAPALKCIFISAKDRVCTMKDGAFSGCARQCPYCTSISGVPVEMRRDRAILELLSLGSVIDASDIRETAKKHNVCPHELSLDTSEYCDVIICDYNYVFDGNVRFKRYFNECDERHIFLIDEAHNLVDRAREMYSATLDSTALLRFYADCGEIFDAAPELKASYSAVINKLKEIALLCKEEEREVSGRKCGWYLSSAIPEALTEALTAFCRIVSKLSSSLDEIPPSLDSAFDAARQYVTAALDADGKCVFFAESIDARLKVSIRCLDPSDRLDRMMGAYPTVLFSATLTPMDYFADVLGCRDAAILELDSPYDPDNLCVVGVDSVSTRYSQRDGCVDEIAEMILAVIEAKEGNYITYFPSYEYMTKVHEAFTELAYGVRCIVQKKGMSLSERDRFLMEFSRGKGETLVGFCVLGGAFAEGVDLAGEKLIGTIIVGLGLPKITSEQNLLREYFESTRENGYDYAFTYPSMIKVQQAAGRVIRGEGDRGIVVLIDDRYKEVPIMRLLPRHWRKIKFASDPFVVSEILERFWGKI